MTPNEADALTGFLQALAITVQHIDQLPPGGRTTESVKAVFDGYLNEIAAQSSPGAQLGLRELRKAYEQALHQVQTLDHA